MHGTGTLLHAGVVSDSVGGVQPVLTQECAYRSSIHSSVIVGLVEKL